ncbi:MAG TPA: hypothetical protein VGR62_04630 [Candidatus Binatia bacterium]|jgi:hypothetical protein|nr:hypothetical protein [Candidatus Binatia bacterium]
MRTAIATALLLAALPCVAIGAVPTSVDVVCDVPASGPDGFKELSKGQSQVIFRLWNAESGGSQLGNDQPVAMDQLLVTKVRTEKYDVVKGVTFYRLAAVIGDALNPVSLGSGAAYLDVTVGGTTITCAVGDDKDVKLPPGPVVGQFESGASGQTQRSSMRTGITVPCRVATARRPAST